MPFEPQELAKFSQSGRAFSAAVGASFETWATGEMGVVLKQWAGHVPEATPAAARLRSRGRATIRAGVNNLSAWSVTANTNRHGGALGRLWFRTRRKKFQIVGVVNDDGQFDAANKHYRGEDAINIAMAAQGYAKILPGIISAGQAAIGLARQSVVQCADALGIALESVAGGGGVDLSRARAAKASDGNAYVNGTGVKEGGGEKFSIEAINRYPHAEEAKIGIALDEVVAVRIAHQMANLTAALTKDTRKVMQAYPYLQTS